MSGTTPSTINRVVERPWNYPGLNRDNAPSRPIDASMISRAVTGLRNFLGFGEQGGMETPFFPPGKPMTPVAPSAVGRRFDYPNQLNMNLKPRGREGIDFETLRAIADPVMGGYDLIRLAIQTRKNQMAKLEWSVLPRKQSNITMRPKSDKRTEQIEELLRRPDGHQPWQQFCSQLIEEVLVVDAPCIYRRRGLDGGTIRLDLMDGALIEPKLNYDGRIPEEGTAYQQVLKGVPAVDYTKEDLLYQPMNPRVHKVYGMSCVEQVLVTVNIGLRRQAGQLAFFTDGNIPDAIAAVPAAWTTAQIAEFQSYWDGMVNDAVTRRKMRFIPEGATFQQTRANDALVDAFDEWLARIIAYCFDLPPTPFVKMQNRATAETAYETALSEGLQPLMIWLKGILDYIIANWLGAPDLELVWDSIEKPNPAEKEQRDIIKVDKGIISIDDMRGDEGKEPLGIGPMIIGIGPLGFMSIASIKKAIDNGWDLTGLPQPDLGLGGDMGAMGAGAGGTGDPLRELGTGSPGDPLAGLPIEILQALGVQPMDDQATPDDPEEEKHPPLNLIRPRQPGDDNVVPLHRHPQIQEALRLGHHAAKQAAARMVAGP